MGKLAGQSSGCDSRHVQLQQVAAGRDISAQYARDLAVLTVFTAAALLLAAATLRRSTA